MKQITPYLFFSGRCQEALEYYREALGAEVDVVMTFDQSPEPTPEGMLQPGFENKVMHASFRLKGVPLMASDGCDDRSRFEGFRLAISLSDESELRTSFAALAEGGTVDMPLTTTFWSPLYGMVTDRFGVGWMLMVPAPAGA